MPNLGATELLIIAVVIVLLFGATKLPQMARSLGQSARVFKAEARGMREDEEKAKQDSAKQQDQAQLPAAEKQDAPKVTPAEDPQRNDSKN